MKRLMLRLVCAIGAVLAVSSVAGACIFWTYQPEVPAELLQK